MEKVFFKRVYKLVKKVPLGKVVTYSQVAKALGQPKNSRVVGYALHMNRSANVPCHRVVDRDGRLATTFGFGGWREQKRRLEEEGVEYRDEMHVDLEKCGYEF
jgi:methylated-DNA-protein-cysteine methyltransferase-like protein